MDLQLTVDSLDAVPNEAMRGAYVESAEGGFKFDLSKYEQIVKAPVLAKNKELLDANAKNKPFVERGKKFEALTDEDYDEYQQFIEAKKSGKQPDDALTKYQETLKAEKAKWQKATDDAVKAERDARAAVEQEFTERTRTAELTKLAIANGVLPDMVEDFVELVGKNFKVTDIRKGTLAYLDAEGGESIHSPADAIKTIFRESKARYFKGSDVGGSGAPAGGTNSNGSGRAVRLTRDEANDVQKYRAAKLQAEKAGVPLQIT